MFPRKLSDEANERNYFLITVVRDTFVKYELQSSAWLATLSNSQADLSNFTKIACNSVYTRIDPGFDISPLTLGKMVGKPLRDRELAIRFDTINVWNACTQPVEA